MLPLGEQRAQEQHGIGEPTVGRAFEPALTCLIEAVLRAQLFPGGEELRFVMARVGSRVQPCQGARWCLGHELAVVLKPGQQHFRVKTVSLGRLLQERYAGAAVFVAEMAAEVQFGQVDHGLRGPLGHGQ